MKPGWQTTFVAVSLLLGEPPEAIAAALDDDVTEAESALRAMTAGSREDRARALARAVSEVALAIDAVRLS